MIYFLEEESLPLPGDNRREKSHCQTKSCTRLFYNVTKTTLETPNIQDWLPAFGAQITSQTLPNYIWHNHLLLHAGRNIKSHAQLL